MKLMILWETSTGKNLFAAMLTYLLNVSFHHTYKNIFHLNVDVYINTYMEKLIEWIEKSAGNAKFFVTLNFSYDVTREQMEKSAREFQKRVSIAIAGNKARQGKYKHKMFIVCEPQPISKRLHLHILMGDIPPEFYCRTKEENRGLKSICSKAWNSMYLTGKTNITGGESVTCENGTPKFNHEWFKPITSLENLCVYVVKTFKYQSSDFLVTT